MLEDVVMRRICEVFLGWCLFLFFWSSVCCADAAPSRTAVFSDSLLVFFWNLENWFDPSWHGERDDEAFTPYGEKHWTWSRFGRKRDRIAHTVLSVAGSWGRVPDVLAFCEVENRAVMEALIEQTILSKAGYALVHVDGPDPRGIECALLYRQDLWELLQTASLQVPSSSGQKPRRPILYVCLQEIQGESVFHLYVNHWPSRLGKSGEDGRQKAAAVLEHHLAALGTASAGQEAGQEAGQGALPKQEKVVVMGDFNAPFQELDQLLSEGLLSPLLPLVKGNDAQWVAGSVRYRGDWEVIDWMMVPVTQASQGATWIYAPDFLLTQDRRWMGRKPFRTYQGPQYLGGVSDHLPIVGSFSKND